MHLRLTLADSASPDAAQELLVSAPEGARFGELRAQLARRVPRGSGRFVVAGRTLEDDDCLGTAPLLRGAQLLLVPSAEPVRRVAPGPAALLELAVVGGPGAGRAVPLCRGEHVVGRAASSDVRLDDPGVSRAHGVVTVADTGVRLRDLDPTNDTTVDGLPVPESGMEIGVGARVRMASTTMVLRPAASPTPSTPGTPGTSGTGVVEVNRRPRFVTPHETAAITWPLRPERRPGGRAPVIASVAPLVLSVVLAVALHSPVMLLFALMSPVMLLGQWWADRRHGRRSHRARLAEHSRLTEAATAALDAAVRLDVAARHAEQPDLGAVADVATGRGPALWERRPADPDNLVLRIGTADQPARVAVEHGRMDSEPCEDVSAASPVPSAQAAHVPAVVDLVACPVVGLAGPRTRVLALAGSLLAQAAVWHSPRTVRAFVLTTDREGAARWDWATHLPHVAGDPDGPLAHVASADDPEALSARVSELESLVAARRETAREGRRLRHTPSVLVVLDGARELRGVLGVAGLLEAVGDHGPGLGVHVIALDSGADRLPAETTAQIVLCAGLAPLATLHLTSGTLADITPDLPTTGWLDRVARAVAPLVDATPDDTANPVPRALGLVGAHATAGLDVTSPDGILEAWSAGDAPVAVLGATSDRVLTVDLVKDGPHCLVGGTTGAGKSELLQTLVAGLAARCRPDDLGFVLVDYKGGSAFKECAGLPHTLGVVTDLDAHLTTRALTSLGAELRRREALLARAGAKDLDDYRRHRDHDSSLPRLARLVIVVDEFKVLADELPDFVDGLVRIAAVGRSLGIHLVLATQRPAGIVTGDMRANISLRIALRVRDRSDSDDIAESGVAAEISDRTPGRAWLRTAGGDLVEFQTAHAGAPAGLDDGAAPAAVAVTPLDWHDLARPVPRAHPSERGGSSGPAPTELARVVAATREAARLLDVTAPPSPWLPPLPDRLAVADLPDLGADSDSDARTVPLGLADRPAAQAQEPFTWHPGRDGNLGIAGGSRSGRTTALRTLALGLAARWSPREVHVHVLEGTSGSLGDLEGLPHVGSVTGSADPALAARVVGRLVAELSRPRDAEHHDAGSPVTVLLVDGWEGIVDAFDTIDHGLPTEQLLRLARDGIAAGVRVVVTGGRSLVTGRLAGNLQRRLVLPMPDPLDLTLAGLSPADAEGHRTTGRAIDVETGDRIQLAHVGTSPEVATQRSETRSLAGRLTGLEGPGDRLPWRVRPLPSHVDEAELPGPVPGRLWVGLGGDDAVPVGLDGDLDQRRVLVTGPTRSGRSAALAVLVRQLEAAGRPTAVVTTRRSPLTLPGGLSRRHLLTTADADRLVELRRRHPDLALLVDDAEGLDGTAIEPVACQVLRAVDLGTGWVIASTELRRAPSLYRGLVPELARHGTGIVLGATSASDGELLGARVEPVRTRLPGRGSLVVDGESRPVQLALPTPDPTAIRCSPDRHRDTTSDLPHGS